MSEAQIQGVQWAMFSGIGIMSLGVWGVLLAGKSQGRPFLPYTPRRPARWGPLGMAVAMGFAAFQLGDAFTQQPDLPAPDEFVAKVWGGAIAMLLFIAALELWGRYVSRASWQDLGWPSGWADWWSDVGLGVVATLAAIGPVYAVQLLLVMGLELDSRHPLIESFQKDPRLDVAIAASFSAVVAAPIFEELLFRQLSQGWLESLEDTLLGYRPGTQTSVVLESNRFDEGPDLESLLSAAPPPRGTFAGLPHGWWPILMASVLFSLAHVGQGIAPIPLFLLAIALGYVYQRTHRIVPCIVVHFLFNAFSMVLVGLTVWGGRQP